MNITMEIRKLPYSYIKQLAFMLGPAWKNLIAIIPKTLNKNNYECEISNSNPHKYNAEHVRLLEEASFRTQKTCFEILVDEWGSSGRVRPAVGHLLYLLIQAELYRAADYVAEELLEQLPPVRPSEGPAALVTTDLRVHEIKMILESLNYPESLISYLIFDNPSTNIMLNDYEGLNLRPKVKRNHSSNSISSTEGTRKRQMHKPSCNEANANDSSNNVILPDLSAMMDSKEIGSDYFLPDISAIMKSKNVLPDMFASKSKTNQINTNNYLPNISALNEISSQNQDIPAISALIQKGNNSIKNNYCEVPDLSILNQFQKNSIPTLNSQSSAFTTLLSNNLQQSPKTFQNQTKSSENSNSSRQSPLPLLNLSTSLPHFTFSKILAATSCFNETPFHQSKNGRFLGSGAFGSVYLGVDLIEKPVAVKKLFLDKVDVVKVDDLVTKQFKNEVEILSRYRHVNLASIVGYSCDGPTYCLLYEFICGGPLKERLQSEDQLVWTDRLEIALGTSKAVSYLHTAYNIPLIHRDIKSANILVDQNNKPKLCDFGLIRRISGQKTTTHTCAIGTSAYMSREAHRGDVSVKLDTYSFGVVLLELITGLEPIDEDREDCDIVTYVEGACDDDNIAPLIDLKAGSWFNKNINFAEELYKISAKCLEENKRKRPTMVTVMEELVNLMKKM